MSKQVRGEWNTKTSNMDYFTRQLSNPYQSTISLFDFLEELELIDNDSTIIDACCGSGCNTFYAAERFSLKNIIGFDYQEEFLSLARDYQDKNLESYHCASFIQGDVYKIDEVKDILRKKSIPSIDGIIFMQTMSWLIDWKESLYQLSRLNSEWIAISSLFYEGLIEAQITINTYPDTKSECTSFPYNVYSIPLVEKYLKGIGFKDIYWRKFEIKSPLEKPDDINQMRTYTIEHKDGRLMQLSGPIMMPWSFVIAKR